jgi:hypothetical protein
MAYKSSLGYSKIGKNTTGTESLQLTSAVIADGKMTESFAIPLAPPSALARVNGSVYYNVTTNKLFVYESATNQWVEFMGNPVP